MTASDKVAFLQGLLERVRRNRDAPRAVPPAGAPLAQAAPAAATPPSPAVAVPPSPVASPPPPPVASPPPPAASPPAPMVAAPVFAPPRAVASPPSFGVQDAPTTPGIAPFIDASGGAEADDLLAAPAVSPERGPRSDVEAVVVGEPDDDIEELDMEEAEVVELGEEAPEEAAAAAAPEPLDVDIDFDDEPADEAYEAEEEPPASSRRPRADLDIVGESMDDALASAAQQEDLEPPLKTPPPESGRQVAAPVIPSGGGAPDIHEFDLAAARPRPPMPTMEQLGSTVDLAGADAPDAEIELAPLPDAVLPEQDELEAPIPSGPPAATYDDTLVVPAEARDELDARRAAERERSSAPPVAAVAAQVPRIAEALTPDVTPRPPVVGEAADFVPAPRGAATETFTQILDASLAL